MKLLALYLVLFLLLISCGPSRNLAYFSNLQEEAVYQETVINVTEPKIQPDDLLSITVSSMNPEANAVFNRGVILPVNAVSDHTVAGRTASMQGEGFLVDKSGFIEYPVIGKVNLGGLTKEEAKATLAGLLEEYLNDPIVNIRYLNYSLTVIGEVNRPSTFTIPSESINILEALGMAGDMTAFGKRENVLIIRVENGVRTMTRLNLNDKEVTNSPYFYLRQNDVVYVEPDKMKQVQASTNTRTLSIITAVTSLAIVIASRLF